MRFRIALSSVVLFCATSLTPNAHATLLPGYSTGTGNQTSSLIIDFGFNGGDAYRFEYHHNGTATSEDMLLALDAAGSLTVHHQFFEFGGPPSIFVDGFSYAGNSSVPVFEGTNGESWSLWIQDNRVAAPGFWTPASTGPTDRDLADGSFDGWALNVSEFVQGDFTPTHDPPAIPEPASAMLLGLAGLTLARRRH